MTGSIWIRPAVGATPAVTQAALFLLHFEIDEEPRRAEIHVSACDRYRLYVNGQSVFCGPRKGDRTRHYYESADLAPMLHRGQNTIAARVLSFAKRGSTAEDYGPMSVYCEGLGPLFVLRGEVRTRSGNIPLSTGEAGWEACIDESFHICSKINDYVIDIEKQDGSKMLSWRNDPDLRLEPAVKAFHDEINPYGEHSPVVLILREIPKMYERQGSFVRVVPEHTDCAFENGHMQVPAGGSRVIELDAGILRTAYFRLSAAGKGGKIKVIFAERYFPADEKTPSGPMLRDDAAHGVLRGHSDEYLLAPEKQIYESFWFRTFRFVRIEMQAGTEPLTMEMPDFLETAYPLNVRAKLNSSDPVFSELWQTSIHTLECCMHETYEDCPYYEQLQYDLDTRNQILFTYAVSGDTRLALNAIKDFHASQYPYGLVQSRYPCVREQVIPDFSLDWILMVEDYVLQTGDIGLIRDCSPAMDAILHYYERHITSNGLVEGLGYWQFADWVAEWEHGIPNADGHGPSALHSLRYALTLQSAARMMRLAGRSGLGDEYDDRAEAVCCAVKAICYDADRDMLREGPDFREFTQHTQAMMVLAGGFNEEEGRNALLHALQDQNVLACTYPWQYTLLRALDKLGMYDLSEPVWEQYRDILRCHLTTLAESPGDTRSDCHAWSALPLYEFPRMLLGVQPDAPGWKKIRIEPHAIWVDSLSGTVPTPVGDLSVSWTRAKDGLLHLNVQAPDVPVTIRVNGQIYEADHGSFEI
ncbi:MAG: hypothetical protein IJL53_06480 [Firmicutes bacterium]|nr:hypothetical protein [Bacillota bacterium]